MKKFFSIILLGFFTLTLGAQTLLDTAINFTAKDPYGETIDLYSILDQEKIVVIDFFSTA